MIKVNELRIGNYIKLNKKWLKDNPKLFNTKSIIKIRTLNYDELGKQYYTNGYAFYYLEPIPLTSQVLTKLGIIKQFDTFYLWKNSFWSLIKWEHNNNGYALYYKNDMVDCGLICSVHELQNLFFSLTGEDLVFSTEP